ncbi:hypothetical protein [Haliangium ochraceum]|uniref:hypothetical protein n=1 Tax=Haliangium ochraceum TaxID=80816 RepID=UPI0018EF424C|nr:hypothetical protein [Haliangium ochraceum]
MKSLLKRFAPYAGVFVLAGTVGACGDDGGDGNTPDIDGGPDPIDAGIDAEVCVGHGCEGIDSPFQLPEGGEVRLERFQYLSNDDPDDNRDLAAQAFFFENQDPLSRGLDGEPVTIRQELADQGYSCGDFTKGIFFDNGNAPEMDAIIASRDYYDVGETVTLTNTDNTAEVIELEKQAPGATDLSAGLEHPILYQGNPKFQLTRNATFSASIDGSQEYPELDVTFGESVVGEEMAEADGSGTPLIYMPSAFTLTSPTEDELFEQGLNFTKGEDFSFTYTLDEPTPAGFPTVVPFVAFLDADFKVEAYCFKTPVDGADPDTGDFTIPYEIFEVVSPGGDDIATNFLFGRFTHVAWEVGQDATRLDFLGVECFASVNDNGGGYTVLDASTAAN